MKVRCGNEVCGKKFKEGPGECPHCHSGKPVVIAKAQCGACGGQHGIDKEFCPKTGKPMAKAAEQRFEQTIAAMRERAEGSAGLGDELEVTAASDVGDGVLAKAREGGQVDPQELIAEFGLGHNAILDQVLAGNAELRLMHKAMGAGVLDQATALSLLPLLIKATVEVGIATAIAPLQAKIDEFLAKPQARRGTVAGDDPLRVTVFNKTTAAPGAETEEVVEPILEGAPLREAVRDMMLKGVPGLSDGGGARGSDATLVDMYVQRGRNLGMMLKAEDAGERALGQRVFNALEKVRAGWKPVELGH